MNINSSRGFIYNLPEGGIPIESRQENETPEIPIRILFNLEDEAAIAAEKVGRAVKPAKRRISTLRKNQSALKRLGKQFKELNDLLKFCEIPEKESTEREEFQKFIDNILQIREPQGSKRLAAVQIFNALANDPKLRVRSGRHKELVLTKKWRSSSKALQKLLSNMHEMISEGEIPENFQSQLESLKKNNWVQKQINKKGSTAAVLIEEIDSAYEGIVRKLSGELEMIGRLCEEAPMLSIEYEISNFLDVLNSQNLLERVGSQSISDQVDSLKDVVLGIENRLSDLPGKLHSALRALRKANSLKITSAIFEGNRFDFLTILTNLKNNPKTDEILQENRKLNRKFNSAIRGQKKLREYAREFALVIDKAKQQRELRRLKEGLDRAGIPGRGPIQEEGFIEFEKLGTTQNPVARLLSPFYMTIEDFNRLSDELESPKINISYFEELCKEIPNSSFKEGIIQTTRNIWSSPDPIEEKLEVIVEFFMEKAASADFKTQIILEDAADVLSGSDAIDNLKMQDSDSEPPMTLNREIPIQFYKDDVLSSLRVLLSFYSDKNELDVIDGILNLMRELNENADPFIDKNVIEESSLLPLLNREESHVLLNQAKYVSTADILMFNQENSRLSKIVENIQKGKDVDHPGFAFKLGLENYREILAGKMLALLNLEEYVMPKFEVKFETGKLQEELSPEGIASEWLEGAIPFPKAHWFRYTEAKYNYEKAKITGAGVTAAKNDYQIQKNRMKELGSQKSIQEHALIDLLFCSYDSHPDQYMYRRGDAVCFDFARFLAPFETLTKTLENGGLQTLATLRSVFIDHPFSSEPLDSALVDKIKGWEVDQVIELYDHEGLIGSEEEFSQSLDQLVENTRRAKKVLKKFSTTPKADIQNFLAEWNIAFDEHASKKELKLGLVKFFTQVERKIKRECFRKVDPNALREFRNRTIALQGYVNSTASPTVQGAFERMYPHLHIFYKVLARIDKRGPALGIGIELTEDGLQQRSLESIMEKAKLEKLATEEELNQMMVSLEFLKASSPPYESIRLTMDM